MKRLFDLRDGGVGQLDGVIDRFFSVSADDDEFEGNGSEDFVGEDSLVELRRCGAPLLGKDDRLM